MKPPIKILYSEENIEKFSEFLEPKFRELKWEWILGYPTKKRIVETFSQLVEDIKGNSSIAMTGGLIADKDKSKKIWIGVDKRFWKVISKEELNELFTKKPRRMLRCQVSK